MLDVGSLDSVGLPAEWTQKVLTSVDWEAVSAVGTLGALWWAIVLAGRQSADRRRQERSIVEAIQVSVVYVLTMCDSARDVIARSSLVIEDKEKPTYLWSMMLEDGADISVTVGEPIRHLIRAKSELERLDPIKIPSPELIRATQLLIIHIDHVRIGYERVENGLRDIRSLDSDLGAVGLSVIDFAIAANELKARLDPELKALLKNSR